MERLPKSEMLRCRKRKSQDKCSLNCFNFFCNYLKKTEILLLTLS